MSEFSSFTSPILDTVSLFHINEQATGTGLSTGARYQFTWVADSIANRNTGPPSEFTFTQQNNVIGQGDAPNFLLHTTLHITVNAQGEMTATVDNIWAECR